MADRRRHRGPHPADSDIFGDSYVAKIQSAVADLSWLLSRSYNAKSALKLVGDRYQLVERQRTAVMRCSCSDKALQTRAGLEIEKGELAGRNVAIDGFNLLTTIEAALSGGVLIQGRDGCIRDMASMHGTYRTVEETVPALKLIGDQLALQNISQAHWVFDRPVSNSGRLSKIVEQTGQDNGWSWTSELNDNPDAVLIDMDDRLVVSADSFVIENCRSFWMLANAVVKASVPSAWIMDTSPGR